MGKKYRHLVDVQEDQQPRIRPVRRGGDDYEKRKRIEREKWLRQTRLKRK